MKKFRKPTPSRSLHKMSEFREKLRYSGQREIHLTFPKFFPDEHRISNQQ